MLGKGKKSIGARNGRCGVQKRFDKDLDAIEKRIPEFFFTSQRTFFSRKCFVFKSFKFRCDETLDVLECLTTSVVGRNSFSGRTGNFDVVAGDAVVFNAKRR